MKRTLIFTFALLLSFTVLAKGPKYASDKTKAIIQKMIAAHGGYEAWEQLETLSFTSVMHSATLVLLPTDYDVKRYRR